MKPAAYARNLAAALQPVSPQPRPEGPYGGFQQINGHHPWKFAVPNGFVEYEARILRGSKVAYFNFTLAKEMGLIAKDHPAQLTAELEKTLVETFALRIVNEYDQLTGLTVPKRDLKQNRYMATRYLQLQHDNKSGVTSGDGRSMWNGQFLSPLGTAWDISSCGTGVTRLSPGSVHLGRPVKTGDKQVSYGSGLADVDEGLTAAILSESFHRRGILTERTLVIMETPEGDGINVRAAPNLLRPSHLFLHLKQGNQLMLKSALDFYIARQVHNRQWSSVPREGEKYEQFLSHLAQQYASFTARLEDEYVFCWLDWDGDNVLMDGGIIDYGSIRQFGLCHHRYRYDDVDRFSTNLKEQRKKARYLVQTFVQLVDFVRTGQKKELSAFADSPHLRRFDRESRRVQLDCLLQRVGVEKSRRQYLLGHQRALVEDFEKCFRYFERREDGRGLRSVPDGLNSPAIFCARTLLRELPRRLLLQGRDLETQEFLELMATPFLSKKERAKAGYAPAVKKFQATYARLLRAAYAGRSPKRTLLETAMRAGENNTVGYATGDGIIHVVDELLARRRKMSRNEFVKLVDALIASEQHVPYRGKLRATTRKLLASLQQLISDSRFSL